MWRISLAYMCLTSVDITLRITYHMLTDKVFVWLFKCLEIGEELGRISHKSASTEESN